MTIKNRTDLKSYFVKNAIPTEGNFADLIDSQLNQAQDGVFKPDGEALSVVAAPGDQKRVLRLYASYPAANPDWMIALNPAQDPVAAGSGRAGFGITDGAGKTKLFLDAATGRIGVGTNTPQVALDVVGGVQANGFRGRYDLVLNDYRTANPPSNVCLQSPPADRDAWIYRDTVTTTDNWGIYHRQIDSAVAGLPANSIGFVGGGASKLQAYVNLADGSAWFAGKVSALGYPVTAGITAGVAAPNLEIGGPNPVANGSGGAVLYLHHHNVIAHQLRYNAGTLFFEAAGNGYGTNPRPTLALGGDVSIEGKHAFRGNDPWLRLNQDGAFTAGVHTPGNFAPNALNVGGVNGWGNPGAGNAWIAGTLQVNGALAAPAGMIFEGGVAHIERDGAIYRNSDGQCYITVDDNLYIRDANTGANWSAHFDTNAGNLELKGTLFTSKVQLGGKWLLSGVGDPQSNDDWLRMLAPGTANYNGGLAANKLWTADGHVQGSDVSLKTDIAPLAGALDKVLALRGVTYRWRDGGDRRPRVGLVAQEVEQVFPELVSSGPSGERGIEYTGLVAPLIEAVKQLHAEVVRLRELRER